MPDDDTPWTFLPPTSTIDESLADLSLYDNSCSSGNTECTLMGPVVGDADVLNSCPLHTFIRESAFLSASVAIGMPPGRLFGIDDNECDDYDALQCIFPPCNALSTGSNALPTSHAPEVSHQHSLDSITDFRSGVHGRSHPTYPFSLSAAIRRTSLLRALRLESKPEERSREGKPTELNGGTSGSQSSSPSTKEAPAVDLEPNLGSHCEMDTDPDADGGEIDLESFVRGLLVPDFL